MTDTCRGWSYACGRPVQYRLTWSYDGARNYPSVHEMCGSCATQCEEWVARTERELLTDLRYDWVPLTAGTSETPDRSSPGASQRQS